MFAMTMAEPFPYNVNPEFAALMAGSLEARRQAYADPAWRQRALAGPGRPDRRLPRPDGIPI